VGGLRTALVGGFLAAMAWAAVPQVAQGATTTTTTVASQAISFAGTAADGTALTLGVQITDVILSRFSPGDPTASPGGPGSDFLSLDMTTDESAGTGPSFNGFDAVPIGDISLALPDGTVADAVPPGPPVAFLEGSYSFVVPAATTDGTLEVTPVTVSAVEYPGAVGPNAAMTMIAFQSARAPVVVPPPAAAVTVPTTNEPTIAPPSTVPTTKVAASQRHPTSTGLSAPEKAAAGTGGGLVVLVLVIPIWRRRAFRRADTQGRVVFDAPPVPTSARAPPVEARPVGGAAPEAESPGVDVKVLGPVVFDGLVRPITTTPVAELLAYLALHPGRSFTTDQLRSAIWADGRSEPKSDSFYTYVSALRRSLPPGSLVKSGTRFTLTDVVTSDWGRFGTATEAHDDRVERLREALALVRGPPFDGALSGRNPPYAWASDLSHQMEVAVEKAGHELVLLFLDSGDPVPADAVIAQVLTCVPASIVAWEDYLKVGSLLGGPRELQRRLDVARHALGNDETLLEPLVRELAGGGS
jgi:hypothetical protein